MKYTIGLILGMAIGLTLATAVLSAETNLPKYRMDDKVELIIESDDDHWFYKCPKNGEIADYKRIRKIDKTIKYQYKGRFDCGRLMISGFYEESSLKIIKE